MTRWLQPPLLECPGERRPFDPVIEGARYRLPPELLLAIWERVRANAADGAGRYSDQSAQQRFHELAGRIAVRGPRPQLAKRTRVDDELSGEAHANRDLDLLEHRVPGRQTLVLFEAHRQMVDDWWRVEPSAAATTAASSAAHAGLDAPEREADAVAKHAARAASLAGSAAGTLHQPLEPSVEARMARLFGVDFGDVQVHAGSPAASGATRALTRGSEIHFRDGEYRPGTPDGDRIIAHELAHVVQLRGGGRPGATAELEAEAERVAWRVAEGHPASIELGAPATGEYNYTDAAGNTIPDPIDVTWSSDPFHLEFKRDDSASSPRLVCTLRYLGPHPIDGPGVSDAKAKTIELWCSIGTGPKASMRRQTATALEIDLYGDGTQIIRIADEASIDGAGANKARKHELEMTLNRASGSYVTAWVRDPSAKASDVTPMPAEDRPGTNPQVWYTNADGEWTVRIDGDGDQYKELELKFKNVTPGATGLTSAAKRVRLKITQLSTTTTVQNEFDLPAASEASQPGLPVGGLFPLVKQVSDGGGPTIIDLTATISTTSPKLLIQPPERTATQTKYKVQAPGGDLVFAFPASTAHTVFGAGSAGVIGNIVNVDLTLGAYQDKFRLTIQPRGTTRAVLGLSQLYRGEPTGGLGAELQIAGPIRFTQLLTGDTSFGLDLDGDKKADLMLYDRLTTPESIDGGGPPENNRNHQVRIVGAAIGGEQTFTFRIRAGMPMREGGPAGNNGIAVSNALAVGELRKQQGEGTSFDDQLDAYEATMMAARKHAVPALLSQATFDGWKALSESMIKLKAQKQPLDAALQATAAGQADAFHKLISDETKAKATTRFYPHGIWQTTNPYAASAQDNVKTTGAGPELGKHIRAGSWGTAFSEYQTVVSGLDRWIVDRTKETKGAHSQEAQQLELLAGRRRELAALDGLGAQPVLAVFQPDEKFKNEQGFVSQVPLSLYYWKTGNKWYLRNLSNPDKTYHVSTEAKPDEAASLRELIDKLDDPDRLPAGRIHYDIPGKVAGEVRTTDGLTWQKALTYLGLALAAAGFTLATFGTGGWAVAGAWAMAASALAGGVAAGIDLGDKLKHGDLDATSAVLDIAQIVGGLAGASALASGRITIAAANAPINARWAGPWARLAVLSSKIYLPATRIGAVADVISFGVITDDMAKQLDAIEARSGDDPSAKGRAKLRLLIQFATLGTMTSLSVKGALPGWSRTRTLVLHPGPDGIPLATLALDASSAVVDTQLAIALEKQAKGLPLQEGEKAMIARAKSLGDLRVTDKTAAEMAVKGGNPPQKGVPISVERTGQVYQDLLAELAKEPPVGRAKGVADREIVADAFFGVTEPGVTPRLAAHDPGVYNPLARRAGIVPEKLGASVPDKFPGGFDVTINGRTIKVLPISKTLPTK